MTLMLTQKVPNVLILSLYIKLFTLYKTVETIEIYEELERYARTRKEILKCIYKFIEAGSMSNKRKNMRILDEITQIELVGSII